MRYIANQPETGDLKIQHKMAISKSISLTCQFITPVLFLLYLKVKTQLEVVTARLPM